MKNFFLLLIACSIQLAASSQYWQQKTDYLIDVTLNVKDKTLDAFERLSSTCRCPASRRNSNLPILPIPLIAIRMT